MPIEFHRLHRFIASDLLNQPDLVIDPHLSLLTSGLIDSFHRIDLALFVEKEYGVRIEDTELNGESFDTLAQLEALIAQRSA